MTPGSTLRRLGATLTLGEPGPALRLEIDALPPWYRHPAAHAAGLLLLVGSMFLGFRWRLAIMKGRNRHLRLSVTEATADLSSKQEELMVLTQRLYELNDAKNRVIGLAAHDQRNPLSNILLYCEMMLEDPPSSKVGDQLWAIRNLGSNMADMIKRLLDVHAIEAGQAEAPRLVPVDLVNAVTQARTRSLSAAERKGIGLAVPTAPPLVVQSDPAQVGQILENFLSNALKFSPPGTTVTLLVEDAGHQGKVLVSDQGPGLTAEDMGRVFGEYARLSARPTDGEASVGLGLSLVKRMAEAMGGNVGVESIPGEGATFWLALPKT